MGGGGSKIDDKGETILEFSNPELKQKPKNTEPAPEWGGRAKGYRVAGPACDDEDDDSRPPTPEPTGIDRDPGMANLLAKYKSKPQSTKKSSLIRPEDHFDPNATKSTQFGFAQPTANSFATPAGHVDSKSMKQTFAAYDDDHFE